MFTLNPTLYSSGIFLPSAVCEKYIKLASFCAVKTLLWICAHQSGDFTLEDIAKGIGSSAADTREALDYWVNEGVLIDRVSAAASLPSPETSDTYLKENNIPVQRQEEKKTAQKQELSIKLPAPTMTEIGNALESDTEFASLCNQVQTLLGDIGFSVQSAVYSMLRGYGLPADIIYILINYCAERDKKSTAFMLSVAKDWYKNDIVTHESAYEYIDAHNKSEKIFNRFKLETGISAPKATPTQENYFAQWDKLGFGVDMMVLAYNKTVDKLGKISFSYTNKILLGWHEKGLKTPDDVENEEKKYSEGRKKTAKSERSYDVEKAKQAAKKKKIVYED